MFFRSVICTRTKKQLHGTAHFYKNLPQNTSQQSLRSTVSSECGGDYGEFMTFLCRSRHDFLSNRLQKGLRGMIGCDKSLLNEIFCYSSSEDIAAMKDAFEQKKDKSLADKLRDKLSGEHENLIIYLLLNGRPDRPADESAAAADAAELHTIIKNGSGMLGFKDASKRQVCVDQFHPNAFVKLH